MARSLVRAFLAKNLAPRSLSWGEPDSKRRSASSRVVTVPIIELSSTSECISSAFHHRRDCGYNLRSFERTMDDRKPPVTVRTHLHNVVRCSEHWNIRIVGREDHLACRVSLQNCLY